MTSDRLHPEPAPLRPGASPPLLRIGILAAGLALSFLTATENGVWAHELSGFLGGEARLFPEDANFPGQTEQSASLVLQPEYYHEWEDGSSFTFVPFYRLDSGDDRRTHFDLRELTYLHLHGEFELRLGVRKVFWGSTEILHLVDIINQTDLVENTDTEDKLGQPMVNLSAAKDWGTLDFFLLPYFRERTFPGLSGRFRGRKFVDTDRARYESSAGQWHNDWAIRYNHVLGDLDFGIYHFRGTGREPLLEEGTSEGGEAVFIPFYEQIGQTGLDLSYVFDNWLWKLEALNRSGKTDSFFAWTGGFEYTFFGIFKTPMDLGVIGEWMYDQRDETKAFFDNDVAMGLRLTANDVDGSEILLGLVQDVDTAARFLNLEASRRFGQRWKLNVELRALMNQPEPDFLFNQRDDDVLQVEMQYYF